MSNEIILNVSELPAPLPMEMALDALDQLSQGQYIKMIHRMQPHPLYNILFETGYKYKHIMSDDLIEIYIWKATDKIAEQRAKEIIENNQ